MQHVSGRGPLGRKPLAPDLNTSVDADPRYVASGTRQAGDDTKANWVSCHCNDGDCIRDSLEPEGHWSSPGVDQVRIGSDYLPRERLITVSLSPRRIAIDDNSISFDQANQ